MCYYLVYCEKIFIFASNGTYLVWDVVPRNVLVDADGDMYVVDAEIKIVKND